MGTSEETGLKKNERGIMPSRYSSGESFGLFHVEMIEVCPMPRRTSALWNMEVKYGDPVKLRTRFDLLKEENRTRFDKLKRENHG